MKRVVISEWLDTDAGTPLEVSASLADLRGINRRFGGVATTQALIARVAHELNAESFSLLEVAAGAGDLPRLVGRHLLRRGVEVKITLLDRAASHLNHGSGNGRDNGTQSVVGNALALPFASASFDLVSCNLFAHHLSPDEIVQFVDEGLRVCRSALLINDLVRDRLHLGLVYASLPLFRSRITRHDAVASVQRSYTVEEMRATLARTAASRVEIEKHFLYRMGVVVWK